MWLDVGISNALIIRLVKIVVINTGCLLAYSTYRLTFKILLRGK